MTPTHLLRWSALAGAAVWGALRVATELSMTARVLAVAPLIVVPLALSLLDLPRSKSTLALALAQPIGAACAVGALVAPVGAEAGVLAAIWFAFTLAALAATTPSLLGRGRDAQPTGVAMAGVVFLQVGAFWHLSARSGITLLGYDAFWAELTAIHFHYAGLAAPILVALTLGEVRKTRKAPPRFASLVTSAVVAGPVVVALGILTSPVLALLGASWMAAGLLLHAFYVLVYVVPRAPRLSKLCLVVSALSVIGSMPLAVAWAYGVVASTAPFGLDLVWMIRLHGMANAHGFCLVGLLGFVAWKDR